MPSKKKKYNARFPAGRIKKIMQSDEEVGKVAQAVPVIISRTLELFVESLLTKTLRITNSRNAKTLSPSHMKQCIMSENQFDFLRELVKNIPDISVNEEYGNLGDGSMPVSPCLESPPLPIQPLTPVTPIQQEPYDLSRPSTSCEFNFAKNLSSLQQQQHPVGIRISNGQSSLLVRSVSNGNSNNTQAGLTPATITAPPPPQGIEITCKESVIAKISIPSLPTDNNASGKKITEFDLGLRNDLKRSWDSISRLRHQIPSKNSTNLQSIASSSNTNVASPSEIYSSTFKNSSLSDIRDSSLLPSPAKLSRLDFNSKEQHNIISSATINNSPTTLSKEKEIFKKSDNIKKEKQKLIMQEPIISIDENVSNKPIVKIDYSNLQLLQNDCNNSKKIENNDNKLIKQITPTTVTPEITNSPVINIDLSKIGTQPPTINFNFNNLLTCDNNISKNSMISTSSSNTLELDEDYDNI